MSEKVSIVGKIWTTFSDSDRLLITNEKVDDLIFAMQFKSGEMRKKFDGLLAEIDCNNYDLNWVEIVFKNAFSKKQLRELKKVKAWPKPEKDFGYQIKWRKAQLLEDKRIVGEYEKRLKHYLNRVKKYEREIAKLKRKREAVK